MSERLLCCGSLGEGVHLISLLQSAILFSRFGDGIATNQLCKMLGGVIAPGHPLGNLYFTAWSHSVISQSLNLAGDLKLGSYRTSRLIASELVTFTNALLS